MLFCNRHVIADSIIIAEWVTLSETAELTAVETLYLSDSEITLPPFQELTKQNTFYLAAILKEQCLRWNPQLTKESLGWVPTCWVFEGCNDGCPTRHCPAYQVSYRQSQDSRKHKNQLDLLNHTNIGFYSFQSVPLRKICICQISMTIQRKERIKNQNQWFVIFVFGILERFQIKWLQIIQTC